MKLNILFIDKPVPRITPYSTPDARSPPPQPQQPSPYQAPVKKPSPPQPLSQSSPQSRYSQSSQPTPSSQHSQQPKAPPASPFKPTTTTTPTTLHVKPPAKPVTLPPKPQKQQPQQPSTTPVTPVTRRLPPSPAGGRGGQPTTPGGPKKTYAYGCAPYKSPRPMPPSSKKQKIEEPQEISQGVLVVEEKKEKVPWLFSMQGTYIPLLFPLIFLHTFPLSSEKKKEYNNVNSTPLYTLFDRLPCPSVSEVVGQGM